MSGMAAEATPERDRQDDVLRRLIGRDPTPEERNTAAAYGDLRWALRAAREDAGLSQTEIAAGMELAQSEVSRLETSIGPATRIGRIRDYLAACRARMRVVVTTAAGREFHSPAIEQGHMTAAMRDALFDGIFALDKTVDDAMHDRRLTPEQAAWLREAFLRHLLGKSAIPGGAAETREAAEARGEAAGMNA